MANESKPEKSSPIFLDQTKKLIVSSQELSSYVEDKDWFEKAQFMAQALCENMNWKKFKTLCEKWPDALLVNSASQGLPIWNFIPYLERKEIFDTVIDACEDHHAVYQKMWSPEHSHAGDIIRIAALQYCMDEGRVFEKLTTHEKALTHPGLNQDLPEDVRIYHPLADEKNGYLALYLLNAQGGAINPEYEHDYHMHWVEKVTSPIVMNQLNSNHLADGVRRGIDNLADKLARFNSLNKVIGEKIINLASQCYTPLQEAFNFESERTVEKLIKVSMSSNNVGSLEKIYASFGDLAPDPRNLDFSEWPSIDEEVMRNLSSLRNINKIAKDFKPSVSEVKEEAEIIEHKKSNKRHIRM